MKKIYLTAGLALLGLQNLDAQYCSSSATSVFDTETWNVTLNGQTQNINQSSGALGSGLSGQYSNYTSQVADVVPTLSYSVSTLTGDDGMGPTYYSRRTSVYIDWNADLDFADPGELIGTSPYAGGSPISSTFPFTVPAAAVTGTTRMRIVTIETSGVPAACGTYTYGETEDYSIQVLPPPSCFPVTGVTVTTVTATSAQVDWTLIDAAQTDWIIEYGLDGFTPGSGTQVPVSSFPHVLNGLNPETAYDIYVYADCGVDGQSLPAPSAGVSITTAPLCPEPVLPNTTGVTQDAATLNWSAGGSENIWDVEWEQAGFLLGSGNQDFGITTTPTDPLSGLASQTDYHWYVRAVCDLNTSDGVDTVSSFVGPILFTTGAICGAPTGLSVSNDDGFDVDLSWTPGLETEWNIQWGEAGFALNGPGANLVTNISTIPYNLSGLVPGTDYQFYVQAVCGSTADSLSGWAGPFTWTSATFCANPSDLSTSTLTANSATLIWTENGSATAWTIEYGPSGFTPGSGTQMAVSSTNPMLTALTANTTYCYYVQANCGSTADSSSAWVGPYCFTTIPSCPEPTNLGAMNISYTAAHLFWQVGGSETVWDVEWGVPGFSPGVGEESGSSYATTNNPYYATGLNPSAPYEFYVRAACGGVSGSSEWAGPYSFKTILVNNQPCNAIDIVVDDPMVQHYNTGANTDGGEPATPVVAGQCMSQVSWCSTAANNTVWFRFTAPSTGAATITTFGEMTNFRTQVALYSTGDCGIYANYDLEGANTLDEGSFQPPYGSTLTHCDLVPGETYYIKVDAATTTGPGNFGIAVHAEDPNVMAGTSLGADVCAGAGSFDLFQTITGNTSTNGTWYNPTVAPGNEFDNVVDFTGVPAGTYPFFYVDGSACGMDTVETSVAVVTAPSAGMDNAITTCNTGKITLILQLNGSPVFGGSWSDDDNTGRLSNGEFNAAGMAPGTYSFTYTLNSGNTCPDETATVTITLTDCLSLEENNSDGLSVYPNPVTDVLVIENVAVNGNGRIEVLDVSGKIIKSIDLAGFLGNYELGMNDLQNGIYLVRIVSENGVKETRVVKQ